ncbi:Uncharacterized protein FKW44_010707 [Caligus rogercresseyi]|uniref:Uncharacterized protein n=1 Tax=Caligus rogercresseyi TaxID=217165 RepID=A0A7T8HH87_CALRO|nr:Uncharacterized protein FKW44_010707 [Caligus rogercresseyi]
MAERLSERTRIFLSFVLSNGRPLTKFRIASILAWNTLLVSSSLRELALWPSHPRYDPPALFDR